MIYIFDLDGTLANCDHRLYLIQNKPRNWPAFHAACVNDEPIDHMLELAERLEHSQAIVSVWSGRDESVRNETLEWFRRCGYPLLYRSLTRFPQLLRMRPSDDYRPGYELKRAWLRGVEVHDRPLIQCAFEDDLQCAEMYRSEGVPCFHVDTVAKSR